MTDAPFAAVSGSAIVRPLSILPEFADRADEVLIWNHPRVTSGRSIIRQSSGSV